jgi:hypothetical protein
VHTGPHGWPESLRLPEPGNPRRIHPWDDVSELAMLGERGFEADPLVPNSVAGKSLNDTKRLDLIPNAGVYAGAGNIRLFARRAK